MSLADLPVVAPVLEQVLPHGADDPTPCTGGLNYITDDIPTAIVGGDHISAPYCAKLLDDAGAFPRHWMVLRRSIGEADFSRTYQVPLYDPDATLDVPPVWFDVGGKQGSVLAQDSVGQSEIATFIYAAQAPDTGLGRLAWLNYDFSGPGDFVRDPAGVVAAGYLPRAPGGEHYVEKYALGADRDSEGNAYVAYLWQEEDEYCPGGGDARTPCFKNDSGHLAVRVVAPNLDRVLVEQILVDGVVGGDIDSDIDPTNLRMGATHPDLVVEGDHLFVTYSLVHYPRLGCGRTGTEPCRGKSDIVLQTTMVEIWKIVR
jgi:hypothetical protein